VISNLDIDSFIKTPSSPPTTSGDQEGDTKTKTEKILLTETSTSEEVETWLKEHGFSQFSEKLNGRTGEQMLRYSSQNYQDLFGVLDGVDLYAALHGED